MTPANGRQDARRAAACVLLLLGVAGLGWLDIVTGPEVGFSLFYLVPIVFAGWKLGRVVAVLVAMAAAVAWYVADLWWHVADHWGISSWNGATRLAIFVAMGLLTARVKADALRTRGLLDEALRLARTDALTGLANSRWFYEAVDGRLAREPGTRLTLVYVDVDNFKVVNDLEGHARGDQVLQAIARRLRERAGSDSIVARLGGDEFALALFGRGADGADSLVQELTAEIEELGRAHPRSGLSLSAGVVHATEPGGLDALVRLADEAMYEAKRTRKLTDSRGHGPV